MLTELPCTTDSARSFRHLSEKFGPGTVSKVLLTIVLESDTDLRSEGLALIDDASRFLPRQRLVEVCSATQPWREAPSR
ncbi:MAG: hypothetical protein U0794_20520 [Isosphaeraceae bacterium]